jgi:hypothetical protein
MPALTWAILTGEYPPQAGGVSDYTRLVARGLAECGDRVHDWNASCDSCRDRTVSWCSTCRTPTATRP